MASSISPSSSDDEWYAYRFDFQDRQFLFVRNLGAGIESVAQLVIDVDTGERLVRKVAAKRCVGLLDKTNQNADSKADESKTTQTTKANNLSALGLTSLGLKPNEFQVLDAIQRNFTAPKPGLLCNIVECYGHEYLPSNHTTPDGQTKTYSVSYWKLYNGESINSRWLDVDWPPIDDDVNPTTERDETITAPPITIIARMLRQVLCTLHYLHTAGPRPMLHHDTHFGNVWIHWPEAVSGKNNKAEADHDKTKLDNDKSENNDDKFELDEDNSETDHNTDKKTNKKEYALPQFYLGDFGVARYLAEPHQTRIERPLHFYADSREPLRDLSIIRGNLYGLSRVLFLRSYHSDGLAHAVEVRQFINHIINATSEVISRWVDANVHLPLRGQPEEAEQNKRQKTAEFPRDESQFKKDTPPPGMEGLIELVASYENEYGKGGPKDETKGKGYKKFMKAERAKAMEVTKERAFRVKSSALIGLQPGETVIENKTGPELRPLRRQDLTLPIHGPWQLVTLDGRPVEGPGAIWHHRPAMSELHDGHYRRKREERERDPDETDWSVSDPLDDYDNEKLADACVAGPLPHGVNAPPTPPRVPRVRVSLAPSASLDESKNSIIADETAKTDSAAAAGMLEVKIWKPAAITTPGKISWADIEDSDEEDVPVMPMRTVAETPGQVPENTPESEITSNPNPRVSPPKGEQTPTHDSENKDHQTDSSSSNQGSSSPDNKSSTSESSSPSAHSGSPKLPRFVPPPGFAIRVRGNNNTKKLGRNTTDEEDIIAEAQGVRRPGRHWGCPDIVKKESSDSGV